MNIFIGLFITAFLFYGCSGKKIAEDFSKDIDNFNEFYQGVKQEAHQQQLIVPGDSRFVAVCDRANIKANDVSLTDLAKLLSRVYNTNISYSSNININNSTPAIKIANKTTKQNKEKAATASSSEASETLAEQAPIENKIYLNLNNVCLEDVFDSLTETYDIGVEKLSYGYTIYPRQLKTETFTVDYHNFYRKGKSSISIVNSQLKTQENNNTGNSNNVESDNFSSISTESVETFWASIAKTVRSILSADKERKLTVEENATGGAVEQHLEDFYVYKESGLIVVTAYPKQLKYIRKFLSRVNNNSTRQVLIEAKILEVELDDEFSNGIQWDMLRKNINFSSFTPLNTTISSISTIHNTHNLSTENDLPSAPISAKIPNNRDFNIVLQALASQGKISVISSPRILVLNNQRALIKSGEDRYYVTNVSNLTLDNPTSNNSTSKSGFDLEPFFSGIALDTTPNIINNIEVLLHIHPMISRVEDENKLITIDNKDTKIPVAMIQSREADTVVKAFSGDIIILGGLTQSYIKLNESGLPVRPQGGLSKITGLFSAKKHISKKVELIILIKPTIITNFDNREDIATFTL